MDLSASYRAATAIAEVLCRYWLNNTRHLTFKVKDQDIQKHSWVIPMNEPYWDLRASCDSRYFEFDVLGGSSGGPPQLRLVVRIRIYRDRPIMGWNRADIEVDVVGNVYCSHHHKAVFDIESNTWRVRRVVLLCTSDHFGQEMHVQGANEFYFDGIPDDMKPPKPNTVTTE